MQNTDGMQNQVCFGLAHFAERYQKITRRRKERLPVVRLIQLGLYQRHHRNRRKRRVAAFTPCRFEVDADIPEQDRDGAMTFDVIRLWPFEQPAYIDREEPGP